MSQLTNQNIAIKTLILEAFIVYMYTRLQLTNLPFAFVVLYNYNHHC